MTISIILRSSQLPRARAAPKPRPPVDGPLLAPRTDLNSTADPTYGCVDWYCYGAKAEPPSSSPEPNRNPR